MSLEKRANVLKNYINNLSGKTLRLAEETNTPIINASRNNLKTIEDSIPKHFDEANQFDFKAREVLDNNPQLKEVLDKHGPDAAATDSFLRYPFEQYNMAKRMSDFNVNQAGLKDSQAIGIRNNIGKLEGEINAAHNKVQKTRANTALGIGSAGVTGGVGLAIDDQEKNAQEMHEELIKQANVLKPISDSIKRYWDVMNNTNISRAQDKLTHAETDFATSKKMLEDLIKEREELLSNAQENPLKDPMIKRLYTKKLNELRERNDPEFENFSDHLKNLEEKQLYFGRDINNLNRKIDNSKANIQGSEDIISNLQKELNSEVATRDKYVRNTKIGVGTGGAGMAGLVGLNIARENKEQKEV